ncbi:MAG: outer membrane receptor protein involved in Fe transport [Saprospiraceae bacterium]|jgi:outer membrane receptor protein involved in Fe transport
MKMRNKTWLLFTISILISSLWQEVQAQKTTSETEGNTIITGSVIESGSQQTVEFATVIAFNSKTKEQITGTTTDLDGTFEIVTNAKDLYLEVSFIGFKPTIIENLIPTNGILEMGEIILAADAQLLDEVVISEQRSTTEFKLDKRVFNVGSDLSSSGASALEVLNNVPSVVVSIEGDVSLRGNSGVQILINGKPSIIASEQGNALGTITADMIDKIEVITNPSAKYDAEGTAGILNIIIKKEDKKGLNGSITLNSGTPTNHSVGLSLNKRTEKFNLFSQIGVGTRIYPSDLISNNINLSNNTSNLSSGTSEKKENYYNFILGTDYHINDLTVMTLSGSYAFEDEEETSTINFQSLEGQTAKAIWDRSEITTAGNPKWQYEFQFKKDFADNKDRSLLFSAVGRSFSKDQKSEFNNDYSLGNLEDNSRQRTNTDFGDFNYTFKLDYTHPLTAETTLETGGQYFISTVGNDYGVENEIGGQWQLQEDLTNVFDYQQGVAAAYATYSYESESWGIKGGLRLENTNLETLLQTTNETNQQNFTDLFPTLHTSYKFSQSMSFQAGYSRRIYRPRMWDLNPFFNIRNNFNIRTGNPNLLPEYSDSYEVNSIYIGEKGSANMGLYHRFTTDVMERVTTFDGSVSTTLPINIGKEHTSGLELNGKYIFSKAFSLNADFNYNYVKRNGIYEGADFGFNASQWSSRATTKWRVSKTLDIELTGNYQSARQNLLSRYSSTYFLDMGFRKKFMKGRTIVSFSVRDIFATRIRESTTILDNLNQYSFGQRGRFVSLGVSYGFGKGDAMEFSGKRRR